MKIQTNCVVSMHYTLKDGNGNVLDSSANREPLAFIQGIGALIPGLEIQLEGLAKGDKINAEVAPNDAYGEVREDMFHVVPKSGFQGEGDEQLVEGIQVQLHTEQGPMIATVAKIEGEEVTLDLNHPLAGQTLFFDVEIMDVREATEDELDHGHVHGPGGHHH
jgi:FKBP-type peptidyl-prolyl cis-trans isomerase SlyD